MRFRRADPNAPPKPQRSTQGRMLITMLAGALCVLGFAPFGWWPLEILGLATLFYQVLRSSSVKAMLSRPAKARMTHCATCPPAPSINIFFMIVAFAMARCHAGSYRFSMKKGTWCLKKRRPLKRAGPAPGLVVNCRP